MVQPDSSQGGGRGGGGGAAARQDRLCQVTDHLRAAEGGHPRRASTFLAVFCLCNSQVSA